MLTRGVVLLGAVALLGASACGDDDGAVCGAGTMEVDGTCVAVGDPDAGADELGCGAGTRPDAEGNCVASTLPSDQRSCLGRFGPIAADAADTVFVDASFAGTSDGSADAPFVEIQAAVDAATDGQTVAIASGTYVGDVTVDHPVAVEGRCAREVTIEGTVSVGPSSAVGASVAGVTITGGTPGVVVFSAPGDLTDPAVRFTTSIVEMNGGAGFAIEEAAVAIDRSEIRLTQPIVDSQDLAEIGSGVYAHSNSTLRLSNSIVEMNGGVGVDIADATGEPVPRVAGGPVFFTATGPSAGIVEMNIVEMNGLAGVRVGAEDAFLPDVSFPLVSVSSNIVEMNGLAGIEARGRNLRVVDNTVTNNGGDATTDPFAIAVIDTRMTITGNDISGNAGGGVFSSFSTGVVAGNDVRGFDAVGIAMSNCFDANVANNLVTDVGNAGIHVFEANSTTMTVAGNEVSGVRATTGELLASGHGIYITQFQGFLEDNFYAVRANHVHDNEGVGISIDGVDPIDGSTPLYLVEMNIVERNQFAGINVQFSGDGDVFGNTVDANTGYGIRGIQAADGAARIRVNDNVVSNTTASSAGVDVDGDGIIMVDSHVGIGTILPGGTILANIVDGNARAGIFATGDTDGFCDGNTVGVSNANGVYDILIQGAIATAGLATNANQTVLGITSSVAQLEGEHGLTTGTEPFDKPL